MLSPGSFVLWNPKDLTKIFCENTAVMFAEKTPLVEMISRVDGEIGRISYLNPNGKKGEIAVLLSECSPIGVPHAE